MPNFVHIRYEETAECDADRITTENRPEIAIHDSVGILVRDDYDSVTIAQVSYDDNGQEFFKCTLTIPKSCIIHQVDLIEYAEPDADCGDECSPPKPCCRPDGPPCCNYTPPFQGNPEGCAFNFEPEVVHSYQEAWTPKVGDVVRLRSGGPKMTVGSIDRGEVKWCYCEWMDDNAAYGDEFSFGALELATD